ncbi:MAG: bifunctional 3-deoxy-7-phosphoheptulonate synthase/chorismate mutase type II [Marinilabiliales bacterium]
MKETSGFVALNEWFRDRETVKKPYLIAGPCSAESREQLLKTAAGISDCKQLVIFRAGVWKPRTKPDSFQGVGEVAFEWLKEIKALYGYKIAVEVAQADHVRKCVDNGIDVIWIGARTTSNPFSIQEIAKVLKNINIPVLIKNPVNPDIDAWIGAIERIYNTGNRRIAAVHRGFFPFEKTNFRNIPKWEIPIELKIKIPDIPIVCDPSHIAGKTEFIQEIAQKALDLNMDGLMIETHYNPDVAKSDAKQQLTPQELKTLINSLIVRQKIGYNVEFASLLEKYRDQIDSIDAQIIELLSKRMQIVEEIANYKYHHNVTILDIKRWEEIINTRTQHATQSGLSHDFIKAVLQLIHKSSIQKQTEIMKKLKNGNNSKS